MLEFSLSIIGILMLVMIYRIAFRSPNVFYKIQSVNTLNSLCVLFLLLYVYYINQPQLMDLAFVYVLINYIVTIIVLKYFQAIYIRE